jgi:hypothetical protein
LPLLAAAAATVAAARPAAADEPAPPRRRDARWSEIWGGPFRSSRLFAMPVADVIGAYQMTVSGDGSLLEETGILSSAGVLAIGFGDLAQLEYRHTAAISIEGGTAPVPAVGVQLKLPLPERRGVPAWAVAFRLGVPRRETFGATDVDETVTDLYLVGRLRLGRAALHGGVRVSSARIEIGGDRDLAAERKLVLPTGGWELAMNPSARLVGELALAPQFRFDPGDAEPAPPRIGYGVLGRLGVRWAVHPTVTVDGSIGYQLEVAGAEAADGLSSIVQWDIRLGGELFVPWGALACRAAGGFCE